MTAPTDNLLFKIDELVVLLEEAGYEEGKILDAMAEYIEISNELVHV